MNIQDKLQFIDAIELQGEAPTSDVFAQLGRNDQNEDYRPMKGHQDYPELKTTSVRLSVVMLEALDALSKRFDLSRTDAFHLAIHTFFDATVNGYTLGVADSTPTDNKFAAFFDARKNFISELDCGTNAKHEIETSTHNDAMKKAKEFIDAKD